MEIEVENNNISAGGGVYIPEDIIAEILVRLPVKSLARFRCLSKTWLYLISSYKFAKEKLRISTKNNAYLHDRLLFGSKNLPRDFCTCSLQSLVQGSEYSDGTQIYLPTDDSNLLNNFDRARVDYNPFAGQGGCSISIVGACNGLVCLVSYPKETLVLWNPTTGKLKKLPYSRTISERGSEHAFGYDEVHDDYKVVESCHAEDEDGRPVSGGLGMKVYSLRTNSWKPLSNWPASGPGYIYGESGKFLNGAIHWIVREFSDDVCWAMVSLDLATHTFIVSHLPKIGGDHDFYAVRVGILGGQLTLYFECPFQMDIWVTKENGVHKSWTKSVSIPFQESSFLETDFMPPLPLVYWVEHGKILINYRTSLGIHDLNNPRPHPLGKEFSVECTTYFESLVSPHLDDELVLGRAMPSEIITEILSRLPVRSLLCFESVSKEWRSLISSSLFVEAHLKSSTTKNDVALIFGPTTKNNQDLYICSIDSIFADPAHALTGTVYSVDDENPPFFVFGLEPEAAAAAEIRFLGSCNGLVCLSLSRTIILVNPATAHERILPNSSTNDDYFERSSYSFGFDQVHGDYKVVELMMMSSVEQTLVQVYSMRTDSWEALLSWPGGDAELRPAKYLNGSLHWSVRDLLDDGLVKQCRRRCIVSLDLATLTFSHSPLPPNILVDTDEEDIVEVVIVEGCLAVCCTGRADMDVWVMKEFGASESWTRVVRVDLGNHRGFARPRPLFFSGDGKILMNYGSSLKIHDSANPQHHVFDTDLRFDAIAFVETLVPVTLLEGGEDEQHNYAAGCC